MRAAAFEKYGLENLNVHEDIKQPETTDHDILIRVRTAGCWCKSHRSFRSLRITPD